MAVNEIFKADDFISVEVGVGHAAGEPFVKGALVGVLVTGSGSDTVPVPDGFKQGVGNRKGWASVALVGGWRVNVPAGATYAVGDVVYISSTGVLGKTASGNTRFGVVTHEPKTEAAGAGSVIVKIGY